MTRGMRRSGIVGFAAFAGAAVLSLAFYSRLPERVATHWDLAGAPNGWTPRFWLAAGGPLLVLGVWLLIVALLSIDPKRAAPRDPDLTEEEREGAIPAVVAIVPLLLAVVHAVILLLAVGVLADPGRAVALCIAAFQVAFGNVIGRVRPSFFVGIRTPWTLSSDEVWRKTHRLAATLLVPAGVLAAILALLLPARAALPATVALLFASLFAPAVWSYFEWRKTRS